MGKKLEVENVGRDMGVAFSEFDLWGFLTCISSAQSFLVENLNYCLLNENVAINWFNVYNCLFLRLRRCLYLIFKSKTSAIFHSPMSEYKYIFFS